MTQPAQAPLTGAQLEISAGDYRAAVTELGAGLRQLSYAGQPLITSYEADEVPPSGAGQLLAPWPNRVDGGRYTFAGTAHQLDLSEPTTGNAIHGLTRWASWRTLRHGGAAAQLGYTLLGQVGYPFRLELSVSYALDPAEGLTVEVSARNDGTGPAPYGTGQHPYFTAGTPLVDDCELKLPAGRWQPADDRGIPDGEPRDVTGTPFDFTGPRAIGDTKVDHAFTGLSRDQAGRAWAELSGPELALGFWAGSGYDWLQVFTGDALVPGRQRRALAIEPMTCPPNAFVSGIDLITLAPGEQVTHRWGLRAGRPE